MKHRLVLSALILTSVLLTRGSVEATDWPRSIVGTWELVVDTGFSPEFDSTVSFLPGGVVIAGPDSIPPPGQSLGVGQGIWKRTGKRRYEFKFTRNHYDAATGDLIFTFVVREKGKVDRPYEKYAGEATATLFFNGGGSLEVGPIKTMGSRMELD